jgi:dual specificity phosphatase 12
LANCRITHILSVIDWKFADDSPLIQGYQHLHIPVDDVDDENLIEWFPRSNTFIEQGLNYWKNDVQNPGANQSSARDINTIHGNSGVLVHW